MAEAIRYFMDEHYPAAVSQAPHERGIDVLTVQDVGRAALPGPDQLTFALAEGRVMVTFDTDYLALHQSGIDHACVAWCAQDKYEIGMLVQLLELLHNISDPDQMRNRVEYV